MNGGTMRIQTKSTIRLRAIRLSVCIPILCSFLFACSSEGDDGGLFQAVTDSLPVNSTNQTNISELNNADGEDTDTNPDDTTTNSTDTDTTTGVVNDQLSCSGSRIWGPLLELGITYYLSEPGGATEDQVPGCRVLWVHDTEKDCALPYTVDPNVLTQVALNGDLNFQTRDQINYQMSPAEITLLTLVRLPRCTDDLLNTGTNTNGDGTLVDDDSLTPLSCNGNRVWGPEDGLNGDMIYISEAGGIENENLRDCAIFWTFRPTQNCVVATNIAETAQANVAQDGTLRFLVEQTVFTLNPADISFLELLQTPICAE